MSDVFKRAFPSLADPVATAGGNTTALLRPMGRHVVPTGGFRDPGLGAPPGEDQLAEPAAEPNPLTSTGAASDEIENEATGAGLPEQPPAQKVSIDFLKLVREADQQASLYAAQVNRRSWTQSLRAFHQEHFTGSKYTKNEWANRSKIFRPKTRSSVRKDMAAVAASMFGTVDAVNCAPGNESDKRQQGAAAVMKELINYRTSRNSDKAAIPWFQVAMGARQDSLLTGICISKQSWKVEARVDNTAPPQIGPDGKSVPKYVMKYDRPDSQLIPGENITIDPAADWTNPIQSASYILIKWPMQLEEVHRKMESPISPWNEVSDEVLRSAADSNKFDAGAIRRAREMGLDRLDETQTSTNFQIVWVYEAFIKAEGEDWTFLSVGDKVFLTDPRPVREVYPEQFGERPLTLGYGALEAHRIFPMSPVESWQMLQLEINDLANLTLDAIKQNVMPVTKIVRGKQIDLDQVRRRSSGSSIIVTNKDDVTWERPPDIPQSVPMMNRDLELEFDDLAGQFNGQTAESNNALSRTLGGLKLVSGAANAVQEFDIRVWIQTWVEPTLAQIVRLEQYYESDPVVIGLCGERSQLFEKYGIDVIDDALLEEEITISVSAGLGSGDPQQRLAKFQSAVQVALPLLSQSKEFTSGEWSIDTEAVMEEVFGGAGYRDGGMRFIKKGDPKPNPLGDLQAQKLQSEIDKNKATAKASLLTGLAAVAKAALGDKQLEADNTNAMLDQHLQATDLGHQHGHALRQASLSETDMGHKHGMAIAGHRHTVQQADQQNQRADQQMALDAAAAPAEGGDTGSGGGGTSAPSTAQTAPPPDQQQAPPPPVAPPIPIRFDFVRDPRTGMIISAVPIYGPQGGMPPGGGPTPAPGGMSPSPSLPPQLPPGGGAPQPMPPPPSSATGGRPGQEINLQALRAINGTR